MSSAPSNRCRWHQLPLPATAVCSKQRQSNGYPWFYCWARLWHAEAPLIGGPVQASRIKPVSWQLPLEQWQLACQGSRMCLGRLVNQQSQQTLVYMRLGSAQATGCCLSCGVLVCNMHCWLCMFIGWQRVLHHGVLIVVVVCSTGVWECYTFFLDFACTMQPTDAFVVAHLIVVQGSWSQQGLPEA